MAISTAMLSVSNPGFFDSGLHEGAKFATLLFVMLAVSYELHNYVR